jgi:hypothetical protein
MSRPEPVTQVKRRRDLALSMIVSQVPYIEFLGVRFDRHGDELTATMGFHEALIGNPMLAGAPWRGNSGVFGDHCDHRLGLEHALG